MQPQSLLAHSTHFYPLPTFNLRETTTEMAMDHQTALLDKHCIGTHKVEEREVAHKTAGRGIYRERKRSKGIRTLLDTLRGTGKEQAKIERNYRLRCSEPGLTHF